MQVSWTVPLQVSIICSNGLWNKPLSSSLNNVWISVSKIDCFQGWNSSGRALTEIDYLKSKLITLPYESHCLPCLL